LCVGVLKKKERAPKMREEGKNEQKLKREAEERRRKLIRELLKETGYTKEAIFGPGGLMKELTKGLVEEALAGEMEHHLGYKKGEAAKEESENHRNGSSRKRLVMEDGELEIAVPRDREGEFEPQLVKKHQRRFEGFDERVIAMYAGGMTVREIRRFLEEQYGVEVSPDLITAVTDSVQGRVEEWRNRPLESGYAIVIFDALMVKIRREQKVANHAVHLALGTRVDGTKEVLGLWIAENEGASFWQIVLNELRNRGVEDMLIAVVDGLKGFPEAIEAIYPRTSVQTCIVHLVRYSLSYCNWRDRKMVAGELKGIYRAVNAEQARQRLEAFAASDWGRKYKVIVESWERNWERVIPFFSYPEEVRKTIYTTNAIESLHMQVRKVIKNRGHFPSYEAATKLIYLALEAISKKWKRAALGWKETALQLALMYGERFTRLKTERPI
jgi:putative transposase